METLVYMDHNATAPVRPEARDAALRALETTGNASSVHGAGRAMRRLMEDARDAVAALVGARPENVIFTSGGTEANNWAVRGSGRNRVLASAVEHPSVLDAEPGIEPIPVDGRGVVDVEKLRALLAQDPRPALVAVMAANNETGVLQPVAEVVDVAKAAGALVHCDAVQAAAKTALDIRDLGCDTLSLSAHKMGGPQGVGALVLGTGDGPDALLLGGGQERRRRAGTENAPGIAGFGAAAQAAGAALGDFAGLARWRDTIEAGLSERAAVRVFGRGAARLANTSCVTMPGVAAENQIVALDLLGVAVSAGSACSSGTVAPSHVLAAMGADEDEAATAIRVSLGWTTSERDVDAFVSAWTAVFAEIGRAGGAAAA